MTTIKQATFAGGELAPSLHGRTDQVKYQTGLAACRNFIVKRSGGVDNRPGTGFVKEIYASSTTGRMIPFVFGPASQNYAIILTPLKMQFVKAGATVTEAAVTITAASQSNPCLITAAGHGYSDGDEVEISGISGMTQLNGRNFKVNNAAANTFELQEMDGATDLNATGYTAYTSGGTAERVYTVTTPYVEADLDEIAYAQSADVLTLVHPNYAPRELSRASDTSWTLSTITFEPGVSRPNGGTATVGTAGSTTYKWRVTAVNGETFEESLPGRAAAKTITHASQAADCLVTTSAAHGYIVGDEVYIDSVAGMTDLNGNTYTIATVPTTTTFTLGVNSTAYGAYTSGGSAYLTYIKLTSAAAPVPGSPHVLAWTAVSGAVQYNVYRELNGIYGYVGNAGTNAFNDIYVTPDVLDTPPIHRSPFASTGNYPSTVAWINGRRVFANTDNAPEKVWMTRVGFPDNLSYSIPLQDDDSIAFNLNGRQVNEIRHLVEAGMLVVLTSGGEWILAGNDAGIITPSQINAKQQTYNGASSLGPILVNGTLLYVQARGNVIRDLAFEVESDAYRGGDLTIFASHLFDGYTISDWAYQQVPNSVVWAVRSDGVLLGLTYLREHQIWAWHRHDTDGTVENVCVVPESTEDAVYLIVKRTIDGDTRRYVERMKTRYVSTDIRDSVFVDSSLTYDGRHTGPTTMTLSGSGWTYTDTLTLTSSASTFTSADVGKQVQLTSGTTTIRFTIAGYTGPTVVTGTPHMTVPAAMRATAISTWALAVQTVTGLWHLEGETVSAFGDGLVMASPHNPSATEYTVSNGSVTFADFAAVWHVGLPYTSDLETLDIDTAGGESLADKKKRVSEVTLTVESTRPLWVGKTEPDDDDIDTTETSDSLLTEVKLRDSTDDYDALTLRTGAIDVKIDPSWTDGGRVFIRNVDPAPVSILAIAPSINVSRG